MMRRFLTAASALLWLLLAPAANSPIPQTAARGVVVSGGACNTLQDQQAVTTGSGATLGDFGSTDWFATKFVAGASYTACKAQVFLTKAGSPTYNMDVAIYSHDGAGDQPSTLIGSWSSLVGAAGISSGTFVDFASMSAALTSGTTYWVVIKSSAADAANNVELVYETSLNSTKGVLFDDDGTGTWSTYSGTGRFAFKLYSN